MSDNPTQWLQQAIEANLNADFRHVQLATRDTDGHPACRTIVYRHLDTVREAVYFITDLRSHKAAEIGDYPRVEACWYLPGTREQFRLRGEAHLVGAESAAPLVALRADIWDRLSAETRRLFVSPAPGTPTDKAPPATPEAPSAPPACFALLELAVDGVDHLSLRCEPHGRTLFRKTEGQWHKQALNP